MFAYVVAAACAVAVVVVASLVVRRLRSTSDDNDPGGPTVAHAGSIISALFLIAFAIAIVVPWTTADAARLNTYSETQAIAEASWAAANFPTPAAQTVQAGLRDYAQFVRTTEWPLMAHGRLASEGWSRLEEMRRGVSALALDGDQAKDAQDAVLGHLSEISAARRQRAMDAAASPPPGLIVITVLTGLAVIVLPLLGGARPRGWALAPLTLMAGLLGVGIFLTMDISHVFAGALAVQPDAFANVLPELQRISFSG